MVIISWIDIFGVLGLDLDLFTELLGMWRSFKSVGIKKVIFSTIIIISTLTLDLSQKVSYYYLMSYVQIYVQTFIDNYKMNKVIKMVGDEPNPYLPMAKEILKNQLSKAFDNNPYKKLRITI